MFDETVMERIAEKLNSSLIILPSSIHETIIMKEMVMDANETVIESELKLSDEIYRYDRDTQTLSLIKPVQPEEEAGVAPDEDEGMIQTQI